MNPFYLMQNLYCLIFYTITYFLLQCPQNCLVKCFERHLQTSMHALSPCKLYFLRVKLHNSLHFFMQFKVIKITNNTIYREQI